MGALPVHASVDSPKPRRQAAACVQGSAAPGAGGRLSGAAGCGEHTVRWSPAVTTTQSTRLSEPWQRHSEPGPAASAEPVVAPPGTKRPGCARSRQGTEFAESRFRASRVTFVRRQRPYRRSPRSRSSGCSSARAKRSSHRCRDKRCSVSSFREARGRVGTGASRCTDRTHRGGRAGGARRYRAGLPQVSPVGRYARCGCWGARVLPAKRAIGIVIYCG